MTATIAHYEYDVALSFAGEDRKYAEQLADCLIKKNVSVFYDKYEEADLWGKNLYEHLASVYKDKASYCVIFISAHYERKLWTTHERRSAQARAFNERGEYILPLRLDDTEIPGIPLTVAYQDLRRTSIDHVCDLVLQKLSNANAGKSELSNVKASVTPAGQGPIDFVVIDNLKIGRVLTGSIEELIFNIDTTGAPTWDTIAIYIPPGFTCPSFGSQMPRDRPRLQIFRASRFDPYGPQWNVVYVPADTTTYGDAGVSPHRFMKPRIEVTSDKECYSIRLRGVMAPPIAGRYLFKIALFIEDSYDILTENGIGSTILGQPASRFIPAQNWPILLVKGEVEPAVIAGTVRHALDKTPIAEAGRVRAHMTMRINPYTGEKRSDLPTIDAVGYFTAAAEGHYEVSGLAPGVYDVYVSATGFPENLASGGIVVMKGETLPLDCYLQHGPMIYGDVFGDKPWPENGYAKIEIYEAPTLTRIPDPSAQHSLVSWSPSRAMARHKVSGRARGPQDVGSPQQWQVQGGTTIPFHFEFGEKGRYGAPSDFDGMVPQLYATWVNGLTPGRYYARAWVSRYDQSAEDGATFQEYYFTIAPNMRDDVKLVIRLHGK